jgi:phenylacetate-CoA ligase
VTTFSQTYPLIRFGTGDLSISERDDDGVRRLKGIFGRTGEAVKVRGMFLHPNQLKAAAGAFPEIKQVAAVVTRSDSQDVLTVQIELTEEKVDRDKLAESFRQSLRQHGQLRIDHIEFVGAGAIDASQRMIRDERPPQ